MTEAVPLNTSPLPVRLRVEDYLLLDESGAFDAYAKTELIEGEIVYINAQHRPHALVKSELFFAIASALKASDSPLTAIVGGSVAMPDDSVPEPDIVLTAEPEGEGLIPLESVALVVEVADTTLANDLGRKARLYARKGVPEYWLVDVKGGAVHQLWAPEGETYAEKREVKLGQRIEAATVDGLKVETEGLR
ncbi:MAG: Uma2 family endonuclease [Sphingomonadaceae bacterium]